MSIYLTFLDIPEMQVLPKSERVKTWGAFLKSHGQFSREALFSFGPYLALVFIAAGLIPQIGIIPAVIVSVCGPFVSITCYLALMRGQFRNFLAKKFRENAKT